MGWELNVITGKAKVLISLLMSQNKGRKSAMYIGWGEVNLS